jgi:hypothetical protein
MAETIRRNFQVFRTISSQRFPPVATIHRLPAIRSPAHHLRIAWAKAMRALGSTTKLDAKRFPTRRGLRTRVERFLHRLFKPMIDEGRVQNPDPCLGQDRAAVDECCSAVAAGADPRNLLKYPDYPWKCGQILTLEPRFSRPNSRAKVDANNSMPRLIQGTMHPR